MIRVLYGITYEGKHRDAAQESRLVTNETALHSAYIELN